MPINLHFRDMFDSFSNARLSQGSVFNFAYHEEYLDEEILGVVISARCDIANSKTNKYSFLPAIPLKMWLHKEMHSLLKKNIFKEKENSLLCDLKSCGFSKNIVSIFGEEKVLDVAKSKLKSKEYESLEKKLKLFSVLNRPKDFNELYLYFEKDIKKIIKVIIENKNMDYFFIDNVGEYGSCVVNLREVHHLDRAVAEKICGGIEISEIHERDFAKYRSLNMKDINGLVMIIGEIRSPYIELLMQRFSENFTRIGVCNPHNELSEIIFTS